MPTRSVLDRVWPVAVAAAHGAPIKERVLDGLCWAEARMPEGKSLSKNPYRDRLIWLGMDKLGDAASKAAAYYARGGARVWAAGIVEVLNRNTRSNRLELARGGMGSDAE
jgi:hypothetical protein